MKKRKVWRFTCEYCRKSGCSGGAIGKHERGCTANPNRVCGLCAEAKLVQKPTADLVAILSDQALSVQEAMNDLRAQTNNCPACILTAVRISGVAKWNGDPDDPAPDLGFDFKAEISAWWDIRNEANAKSDMY